MLRLSKLTDYAVVVLMRLGHGEAGHGEPGHDVGSGVRHDGGSVQNASGIAHATGVPEPTVAKVLKLLAAADLVVSTRGARGGYRRGHPLAAISVANVIAAIDGPIALTACVDGAAGCEVQSLCAVRGRWDVVNGAIRSALSAITLADLKTASIPPAFRLTETRPAAPASAAQ